MSWERLSDVVGTAPKGAASVWNVSVDHICKLSFLKKPKSHLHDS
jgi:hypothetical protein